MKITEENFIAQMKKKDERALEYVIEHYGWIIKTVLKKHLFHLMHVYDECMNDCILAVWENIDYYDSQKSGFKNWVGGIAKYKAIDYTRKHLKDLENVNFEDQVQTVQDASFERILSEEILAETSKMLNVLSQEDQLVFKRLYLEEQNLDEVSQETGLSKNILYNRISRAKKKLRREFSE